MDTLELFNAMFDSLVLDKNMAIALRTGTTSGTGKRLYSEKVRSAAAEAHNRLTVAQHELFEAGKKLRDAIALHNVAQKLAHQELTPA